METVCRSSYLSLRRSDCGRENLPYKASIAEHNHNQDQQKESKTGEKVREQQGEMKEMQGEMWEKQSKMREKLGEMREKLNKSRETAGEAREI